MCGIAGFYNPDKGVDRRAAHAAAVAMHEAMPHRGPDSADVWQDPECGIVLAHRRLSIVDLSAAGAQPMSSSSGRYVVTYNGEIYNFQILRENLIALGHSFKGNSDTEVFLAAVEQWGFDKAIDKINGMFAIVLWDRNTRTLHFARDRFGKKPLYIGWAGKSLIFASELKAFHKHPDFKAEVNRDVAASYMRFGYVCAPHCIFKNVWQLPAASKMSINIDVFQSGEDVSRRFETYWSLKDKVIEAQKNPVQGNDEAIMRQFEDLLLTATKNRMMSDVPLGSFLSGGIDSSLVTAMMQKNSSKPIKSFSIGFEDGAYDESKAAAKIAAHLGCDHQSFTVTSQEAQNVIPLLPDMFDEPFADQSQIPTYLLSKMAKSHVTVALTGDGGDEIMGGYQRHTHIPPLWNKVSWIPPVIRRTAGTLVMNIPQDMLDHARPSYPQFGRRLHRMAQAVMQKDEREIYTAMIEVWPKKESVVLGSSDLATPLDDPSHWPSDLTLQERMIYADTLSYRPNDLMVKTDRAAMAASLEARAPLMDYELCEFSWRLPMSMKIRGFEGKWLLRRVLEKHIPNALFDRPKTGFGVPMGQWLRGPLKAWGDDLLHIDALKKRDILNPVLVAKRWQDFQNGKEAHANANDLWAALMFVSWQDRWMR